MFEGLPLAEVVRFAQTCIARADSYVLDSSNTRYVQYATSAAKTAEYLLQEPQDGSVSQDRTILWFAEWAATYSRWASPNHLDELERQMRDLDEARRRLLKL